MRTFVIAMALLSLLTPAQAVRLASTQVVVTAEPPTAQMLLIGDSVIAALDSAGATSKLSGASWTTELAVCRRLVAPSCAGPTPNGTRVVPDTALTRLGSISDQGGAAEHGVLVIATGYNDSPSRFESDVKTIIEAAEHAHFDR